MWEAVKEVWPHLLFVVHVVAVASATIHAVLYKREVQSVIGWVGLVWLTPIFGSILYFCFGVNRINRRALALKLRESWNANPQISLTVEQVELQQEFQRHHPGLASFANLVHQLTGRPALPGNRVEPLRDGEECYPSMLAAIDQAEHSVALLSYIFDSDRAGEKFLDALVRANERGVEVRVLIDDVGSRYSRPNMVHRLKQAGVSTASFLPTRVPLKFKYANLRNHRKILIVDGRIGFTGGTNIREGHCLKLHPAYPVQCLHFRIEGPVVAHMLETFAIDWAFVTGESLEGETWFPVVEEVGDVWARGISDGPDDDLDQLPLTIMGALAAATKSVHVVTPYFLPDPSILNALNVAALRGVDVDIVLPSENNIRFVQWAATTLFPQLLERGCRIYLTPPPFDHTKLMVVDGMWALVGSTNWDPRSLRLNFEFNVECYHHTLASHLEELVNEKIASAHQVTLDEVESRSLPVRIRDGCARLASPYL